MSDQRRSCRWQSDASIRKANDTKLVSYEDFSVEELLISLHNTAGETVSGSFRWYLTMKLSPGSGKNSSDWNSPARRGYLMRWEWPDEADYRYFLLRNWVQKEKNFHVTTTTGKWMTGCTWSEWLLEKGPVAVQFWNAASHLSSRSKRAAPKHDEFWQGQEKSYVMWHVRLCLIWRHSRSLANIILGCMELYNTIFISSMLKGTI